MTVHKKIMAVLDLSKKWKNVFIFFKKLIYITTLSNLKNNYLNLCRKCLWLNSESIHNNIYNKNFIKIIIGENLLNLIYQSGSNQEIETTQQFEPAKFNTKNF